MYLTFIKDFEAAYYYEEGLTFYFGNQDTAKWLIQEGYAKEMVK